MHITRVLIRRARRRGLLLDFWLMHLLFLRPFLLPLETRMGMVEDIQLRGSLSGNESILISIRLKCIFPNYFPLMIIK